MPTISSSSWPWFELVRISLAASLQLRSCSGGLPVRKQCTGGRLCSGGSRFSFRCSHRMEQTRQDGDKTRRRQGETETRQKEDQVKPRQPTSSESPANGILFARRVAFKLGSKLPSPDFPRKLHDKASAFLFLAFDEILVWNVSHGNLVQHYAKGESVSVLSKPFAGEQLGRGPERSSLRRHRCVKGLFVRSFVFVSNLVDIFHRTCAHLS